jgi:predicted peptidase
MSDLTRRGLLIGGATVAAVALTPDIAHATTPTAPTAPSTVHFTLDGTVLDGGEQVTSLTLDTSRFGWIDPASLTASTFTVHFTSVLPFPLPAGETVFTEHPTPPDTNPVERPVTKAHLEHGKIVLDLLTIDQTTPGGTLGYLLLAARNVLMKQTYTITQNKPLKLVKGGSVTIKDTDFIQGKLVDPEVDAYSYHKSSDGMNYRLFSPSRDGRDGHWSGRGKRPLIVWLHGGGEGGLLSQNYYDNEPTLRANRGALGFSTPEAQKVFGGAYVVAPQAETFWLENGPKYSPRVRAIILDLIRRHPIDPSRIYLAGCSNGGYLTMEMTSLYHDLFAAAVPICGVVRNFPHTGDVVLTDAQLKSIRTPSWLVCAKSDTTVPPVDNSEIAAKLIPGAIFTEFDTVTKNGITYPGHWSWIYVARNDPQYHGQHVWQWMASKKLSGHR